MTTLQSSARTTRLDFAAEAEIARPAQDVWTVLANYRNDSRWRRGVRRMDPTPAGLVEFGTTTDEAIRLAGSTYRNLGLVTAVDVGRSFEWETTKGADAWGSRTVGPLDGGGCRVRLELHVRVVGVQRLMAPLLAILLRRNLSGDVERLRLLLENGSGA
jgi:hypothetical protein